MKNAATCDTWCELQGPSEPSSLRTHIAPAGNPAGLPVRAPPQTDPRPSRAALAPAADPTVRRGAPKCIWRAARARGRVPRPRREAPGRTRTLPPAPTPGAAFVSGGIARRGGRGGGRRQRSRGAARTRALKRRPRIGQGYPPNLSISVSGGKETNRDCPSSGERSGNSPDLKSGPPPRGGGPSCSLEREPPAPRAPGPSRRAGRVPWNGAPQRVRAPCGRAPRVRTAAGGRVPRRVG